VDIPGRKRVEYSLRYLYASARAGPGHRTEAQIPPLKKADELSDEEMSKISTLLQQYRVEGDLRRESSRISGG